MAMTQNTDSGSTLAVLASVSSQCAKLCKTRAACTHSNIAVAVGPPLMKTSMPTTLLTADMQQILLMQEILCSLRIALQVVPADPPVSTKMDSSRR